MKLTLNNILEVQEKFNPVPHVKKFEIIKGDASKTLKNIYQKRNKQLLPLHSLIWIFISSQKIV